MKKTFCDICRNEIKQGQKKYILAIKSVPENKIMRLNQFTEFTKQFLNNGVVKSIHEHEICENCKNILVYLFNLRKKELKELTNKVNALLESGGIGVGEL